MACPALIADPAAHCASGTYWEEAILHVALQGVSAFGYWGTPAGGATNQTDVRMSRVLDELDTVVGEAGRSPHNVSIIDWLQPLGDLVVSSMQVRGAGRYARCPRVRIFLAGVHCVQRRVWTQRVYVFLFSYVRSSGGEAPAVAMFVHRVVCLSDRSQLSAVEQADGSVKVQCDKGAAARLFPRTRVVQQVDKPVSEMGRWLRQSAAA